MKPLYIIIIVIVILLIINYKYSEPLWNVGSQNVDYKYIPICPKDFSVVPNPKISYNGVFTKDACIDAARYKNWNYATLFPYIQDNKGFCTISQNKPTSSNDFCYHESCITTEKRDNNGNISHDTNCINKPNYSGFIPTKSCETTYKIDSKGNITNMTKCTPRDDYRGDGKFAAVFERK